MKVVFARFLGFLKYFLLIVSFALTFYGIIITYRRLDKNLTDAIGIFVPFILIFIVFVVNLFIKSKVIRNNLLYNAVSVLVFIAIIIIGYRAKFDTNMALYHKYGIDYNPAYLADNLSVVQVMLYALAGSNILLMISSIFDRDKKKVEISEDKDYNIEEKKGEN